MEVSKDAVGLLGCLGLLVLVFAGVRVYLAAALVGFLGMAAMLGFWRSAAILGTIPHSKSVSYTLSVLPLFILIGYLAYHAGMTQALFRAAKAWIGWLPGGLAIASVAACAFMSAASGSSVAVSAAMARIATPEMLKYKYDPGLAAGVIASAGTLGSMIPPSLLMVIYGYFADVSIAKLFMAGFVPGIMSAMMFAAMIITRVKLNPALAPPVAENFTAAEKATAMREVWPLPVLILGVLVSIFAGICTPTEGAALGAMIAIILAMIKGTMSWRVLNEASVSALSGTSSIFMVIIGTVLLAKMLALTGVPEVVTQWLVSMGAGQLGFILMVVVLYLILGCFLDSISILLLTMPIIMPIARAVGADLVWFGIILVKLLEIGLVTPPVGLNVYVMKSALGSLIPLTTIFRGIAWFVVADMITLVLIIAFPMLTLILPQLLIK